MWNDPWLRDDLNFRLEGLSNDDGSHLRVSDLTNPNTQGWDVARITALFSSRDAKEILSLVPPSNRGDDRIIWHWTTNGVYSVKSGYRLISERLDPNTNLFVNG